MITLQIILTNKISGNNNLLKLAVPKIKGTPSYKKNPTQTSLHYIIDPSIFGTQTNS